MTDENVSIEELVDRCGQLARDKAALEKEMSALRKRIVGLAEFEGSSKTARLAGRLFVAKVEKKEEIKYDRDALAAASEVIGEETFSRFFDWEYVPAAKKAEIDAFIKMDPNGGMIAAARKYREMASSVSFSATGD